MLPGVLDTARLLAISAWTLMVSVRERSDDAAALAVLLVQNVSTRHLLGEQAKT